MGRRLMREIENRELLSASVPDFRSIGRLCCSTRTRPLWPDQSPPRQVKVGQSKCGIQARGVLGQTAIADLSETPEVLDDPEGVLAAGTGLGTHLIDGAWIIGEWPR